MSAHLRAFVAQWLSSFPAADAAIRENLAHNLNAGGDLYRNRVLGHFQFDAHAATDERRLESTCRELLQWILLEAALPADRFTMASVAASSSPFSPLPLPRADQLPIGLVARWIDLLFLQPMRLPCSRPVQPLEMLLDLLYAQRLRDAPSSPREIWSRCRLLKCELAAAVDAPRRAAWNRRTDMPRIAALFAARRPDLCFQSAD